PPAGDLAGLTAAPGAVAPGCGVRLPLPRSNGEGEIPAGDLAGAAVAPGGTGPPLPLGLGETGAPGAVAPAAAVGLAPAAGGAPPGARPAPPVGGGTLFGFSVLIFCFSCASLGTPAQPRSIFGCATLAFTFGGAMPGAALVILFGAATINLLP